MEKAKSETLVELLGFKGDAPLRQAQQSGKSFRTQVEQGRWPLSAFTGMLSSTRHRSRMKMKM